MAWPITILIFIVAIVLLAIHRATHAKRGGEEQPTNLSTPSFQEALTMSLRELQIVFDEAAHSSRGRSCYQASELLEQVCKYTVELVKGDFAKHPERQRIGLIRPVITFYLRKVWKGKVRNRRKRALLGKIQKTWEALSDGDGPFQLPSVTLSVRS